MASTTSSKEEIDKRNRRTRELEEEEEEEEEKGMGMSRHWRQLFVNWREKKGMRPPCVTPTLAVLG
jgi:hypothetical protein